ncbi:MAG: 3-methyl-2-oxobutanoate dehydrogenase subunit beta [Chloroflexi bacterium]|nr:MAG: 3-methyl-2-oxobutanoate dehydrogenase subunit beta [Chloroflexota bacterium]
MTDRMLVQGNEAVGWGALVAECDGFFGYPITPQNEITEFFAREMPKRGKVFVQSQSETGSIMMVFGGAAAGFRVMTSTSSPGWSLMQEGMSHLATAELPCVVVLVQRGGPGQGSIRHAQMDYLCVTRTGGGGGYKNIVLAPASVQETHDLVQMAFYLADKYSNPVVVLLDAILGLVAETLEFKKLDFGPLPEKAWAVRGRDIQEDKGRRYIHTYPGAAPPPRGYPNYVSWLEHIGQKYQQMKDSEVRYETYRTDDAELLLVAYGYVSRVCKEAVNSARAEGRKVGLIRPITLWPFPSQVLSEKADQGCRFLVIEDSLGQMVDDVKMAVLGRAEVNFMGVLSRHIPTDGGMILPGRVLQEIRRLS